ncbi:WD40 repeat domain-containing serine/threonine protein kinase [Nocardiopsis prasina]|uniref:WD40 repeat domain-containing serine/threonine protein kinase n=1 Tax=Nocardiopsis prasina TaxID=2015 RepID=UPI000476AC6A|nr:WD40 repeat domain-containing serine/threonine protein kinase [Nocardiopsis prasina]
MQPLAPDDPNAIGPHRLLARLGAGGMGRVYLARTPDGHLCALKVVKEDLAHDTQFRARFAREVRTAQRVRGPFTPAVVDADPEAPAPWMATEYVPGPTLKEAVRENGPFPEDSLRVLALGLARALSTIHAAGLMHRDLKPSNILLSPRGPQVIDFGIARAVEGTVLTRTGQTFGTPSYTSPEQVTGQNVTPHADVFSMAGAVLFAASGRPPFGEGSPVNTLNRVMRGEPHLEAVPEGPLRDLLARCFAKDPAERPDADTVQREISALPLPSAEHGWLPSPVNQQITARASETQRAEEAERPPSPPERGRKRRRTALVVGAAAASLVLLGGGALALNALPTSDNTAGTGPEGEGNGVGREGEDEPGDPPFAGFLYKIDFSEDGERIHVFGSNTLSTWNWRDGEAVDRYVPTPTGAMITPNGFAAGSTTHYVEVWDGGSDNRVAVLGNDPEEERGHFDMPALTSDGSRVATLSSADGTLEGDPHIQVWDVQTSEVLSDFPVEGLLSDLFYTPDDSALIGVVTNRSYTTNIGVFVWDPETGEELQRFDDASYSQVSLASDGRTMAMVTDHNRVRIADIPTGEVRELEVPELNLDVLVEARMSVDGSLVYGATTQYSSEPGFVWDARSGDLVDRPLTLQTPIGIHPDGEHIAAATYPYDDEKSVLILDADFDVVAEVS